MDFEKPGVTLKLPASKLTARLDGLDLVLRPRELTDAPAITLALQESLTELRQFMPWAHFEQNLAVQLERSKIAQADHWGGRDQVFGAFDAQSGDFLASVGLHYRTLNPQGLEIGYWTRTKLSGRGIATLSTKMLLVYCFEYLGCDRLQCLYAENNLGSARVFAKCGFKVEGRLRNYSGRATPEMRANAYVAHAEHVIGSIIPTDVPGLAWYGDVKRALTVYDWQGRVVPAP